MKKMSEKGSSYIYVLLYFGECVLQHKVQARLIGKTQKLQSEAEIQIRQKNKKKKKILE